MARNKQALVLLLDVGPSMHSVLPLIQKVFSLLIQKKLIYKKFDEVGVVCFGTQDTDNELAKELGGYEHVMVLRNIKVVDGDLFEALQHLPRGNFNGDYLDAIVSGMDMLIKKYQLKNKGKKHLYLVTNAVHPIKDSSRGTKEDQVKTIAAQMNRHGMRMESIIVRGKMSKDADLTIMRENDHLLNVFSQKTSAKMVYVESPISLLGALRTRNVSPVTIFRGDLELSTKMKIKVWVYKKTCKENFPTLKRFCEKVPPADKCATCEVKLDYEHRSVEDPGKVVPPEQRIKGYWYGQQVVPIPPAKWDAVRFKPEKGVKLLGFTNASNIFRHYFMKDVNIFIAEQGDVKATLAVSALSRAMKEMDKVAILRCVWRKGQGSVVVGALTPNISEKANIPDSFYFNVLPFAEDVEEFEFPSFSDLPSSYQPTEQQQEAADNLVKMLDLAASGKEEVLLPDLTPNPVLERFYRHLELKSKHSDAPVPPLDKTLKMLTEPDLELFSENKSVIDAFRRSFAHTVNLKRKRSTINLLSKRASGLGEGSRQDVAGNAVACKSTESISTVKVEKIGDSNPVQDFEAMLSRRDGLDWIGKAIKNMKNKIYDLVEDSYEGDNYPRALECLFSLRKGCILEQEPKQFNDFLHHLSKVCREKKLGDFCEFLVSKELKLISKSEAVDSDVADDEARSFMVLKGASLIIDKKECG